MRWHSKLALLVVALLLGLPLVALASALLFLNAAPGHALIERTVSALTHDQVHLEGISGRLPDRPTLAHLVLRDSHGTWLEADGVMLQWSPLELLHGEVRFDRLEATRVALPRGPRYASSARPTGGPGWWRRFRVYQLGQVELQRLELGAPLTGSAVAAHLQGALRLQTLENWGVRLSAQRLDGVSATYQLDAQDAPGRLSGQLDVNEAAQGPLAHLLQVPALGALAVKAHIGGPLEATEVHLDAQVGPLHAAADGSVNLRARALRLEIDATAPAMSPRPDLGWQSIALHGHADGPFSAPQATGKLALAGFHAGSVRVASLQATVGSDGPRLTVDASAGGLELWGPIHAMLADSPLHLRAQLQLATPARRLDFALSHALLSGQGYYELGGSGVGEATASVPDVHAWTAMLHIPVTGRASLQAHLSQAGRIRRLELSSLVNVAQRQDLWERLLGGRTQLGVTLLIGPDGVQLPSAHLESPVLTGSVQGGVHRGGAIDFSCRYTIANLAALSPALEGAFSGQGRVQGRSPTLSISASATAQLSAHGSHLAPLQLALQLQDVPQQITGTVALTGTLADAPLALVTRLRSMPDGGLTVAIERGEWKSASASGTVQVGSKQGPIAGGLELRVAKLTDLEPITGRALHGDVAARVELAGAGRSSKAEVLIQAHELGAPGAQLSQLELRGQIDDPLQHPALALQLRTQGQWRARAASLEAKLDGPLDAIQVQLSAKGSAPSPMQLRAAAEVRGARREVRLTQFSLHYQPASPLLHPETLQLLAPALFSLRDGFAFERVRLGVDSAQLQAQGELLPKLDVRASLHGLTPALARAFFPWANAEGTAEGEAQLQGTLKAPLGHLTFNILGLRASVGAARGLPALELRNDIEFRGTSAQLQMKATAGSRVQLAVSGEAPLGAGGALGLKIEGHFDLSLIDPILEASGQRVLGQAVIAAQLGGTLAAPDARGTLTLADADLQDFARGVHLTRIAAALSGQGNEVKLERFSAHAGTGTVNAEGAITLGGSAMPVALTISARNAQPLASDLLTATVNTDLKLSGTLPKAVSASGTVHVAHAVINIPNALPPSVEQLHVIRPGEHALPPPPKQPLISALDITIDAPRAVFVRGRGLDAELGGRLQVSGNSSEPTIGGGFDLRSGSFNLAGATLTFTTGKLTFNGEGVHHRLDPTLDFTATNMSGGITSTLTIGGYADAPQITLSSVPQMPQDEVLSRLLFGVSVTQLSGLQVAQIGTALATMSGIGGGGGGFNPIASVQQALGLDRLAISGGSSATTAPGTTTAANSANNNSVAIEAGRYVSSRVYLGAKQTTTGLTQAEVQVDLTRHLKIQTTVGDGGSLQGATPQNDPGDSIGLTYQFEF
jgi:translocation and assembly module TamB